MDSRLVLREQLQEIMGSNKVYFDPPTNTTMEYPCIKYELIKRRTQYANGNRYIRHDAYTITLIDKNHKHAIEICEQIEKIKYAMFDRTYVSDGLHHYVYTITI